MRKPGLTIIATLLVSSLTFAQTAPPPLPPLPPPPMIEAPPAEAFRPMAAAGPLKMEGIAGQLPPVGYHVETEVRTGLVIGGAVTFGVVWVVFNLFPAAVGSAVGCRQCNFLIIPAIGPIILAAQSNPSLASLLVLDAIVQAGGLAMLITGIAAQRTMWVRDGRMVQLVPILSPGMNGLGLVGRF